jgi:hypothetical protein
MLSLDNKCPHCGKTGREAFLEVRSAGREVTLVVYCDFCFFRPRSVRLCSRVSQALLSESVLSLSDPPIDLLFGILSCSSVIPTTGPIAEKLRAAISHLLVKEGEGDSYSHTRLCRTAFGRLIWFAGMYGHRFITLDLVRSLMERSVVPGGTGEHTSGESL